MKITSASTYVLPFLILLATSLLMIIYLFDTYLHSYYYIYDLPTNILFYPSIIIVGVGLYFGLKKLSAKVSLIVLKIVLIGLPFFLSLIVRAFTYRLHGLDIIAVFLGLFLYFSYLLLSRRYTATLTDTAIEYKNLFDQTGEIPLSAINKLEQKKNLLTIFREFRLLNLWKKTSITFCDENLDEYEINIFPKAFQNGNIFDAIIERANTCGNLKIRQYVI